MGLLFKSLYRNLINFEMYILIMFRIINKGHSIINFWRLHEQNLRYKITEEVQALLGFVMNGDFFIVIVNSFIPSLMWQDYEDDPFTGGHKIAPHTCPEVSTEGKIEW